MEFVIYALDRAGDGAARRAARAAHLRGVVDNASHFIYGGPLLDEQGKPAGSLFVMRFADRAALDAYMASDPYFTGDVFGSVTVWASRQIVPETAPGFLRAELQRQLAADAESGRG